MMHAKTPDGRKSRKRLGSLVAAFLDRRGVSAVEFALVAPILIFLPVPIFDIGSGLRAQMQLDEAVQAGAQYVIMHNFNSGNISSAMTASTSLALQNISATESCGCPTGNTITVETCGYVCPNGTKAGKYATITVNATYKPLIHYPTLPHHGSPLPDAGITLYAHTMVME